MYAILALSGEGETESVQRGIAWLRQAQRADGGWSPQTSVYQSCWVTALVALLSPDQIGDAAHARAIAWLVRTMGIESTFTYRVRSFLLGNRIPPEQQHAGWPWVPGTAAWVAPTALAVLALQKDYHRSRSRSVAARIEAGRQFLLSRTCAEGGWNHGGVRDLGYLAHPYPEVTGMALAALRGANGPKIERALSVARTLLDGSRSADALNWLRLGLIAHNALPTGYSPPLEVAYRTMPDVSLRALVAAVESGRSFLWG